MPGVSLIAASRDSHRHVIASSRVIVVHATPRASSLYVVFSFVDDAETRLPCAAALRQEARSCDCDDPLPNVGKIRQEKRKLLSPVRHRSALFQNRCSPGATGHPFARCSVVTMTPAQQLMLFFSKKKLLIYLFLFTRSSPYRSYLLACRLQAHGRRPSGAQRTAAFEAHRLAAGLARHDTWLPPSRGAWLLALLGATRCCPL